MKPFRVAQVAAARATTDIDDGVIRLFTRAFSEDLHEWLAIGVPFSFDTLAVTTRLAEPRARDRLRDFLLEVDLPDDGVLCDALDQLPDRPVEVSLTAGRASACLEVRARFAGHWTRRGVYEALPGLGVSRDATRAWDRAVGAARGGNVLTLAVAVGEEGPRLEVEIEQRFDRAEAGDRAAQLGFLGEHLGIAEPGRLARIAGRPWDREPNVTSWTVVVGLDRVLPALRVTVPCVPASVVLALMGELGASDGYGRRLGAIAAALRVEDDVVWRLHIDAGTDRLRGSVEILAL
ncbi:MAG: hypothetical protein HY814_10905 [Candidatus Riflebacteria bacterium]|nr:hypothetical protein [Candidatus Riflebacteria bacterium]